jgi:DnaJ-class molecular chaperone
VAANRDYYRILSVRGDATTTQIKAAFRKKAMRYHPDHNPGKEAWANKKLQGIIEAYEVLSNPARRRLYDRQLVMTEGISVRMEPRRRTKSTKQHMVDIMRHQSAPVWARTVAFAYVFFDYFSKESRRVE